MTLEWAIRRSYLRQLGFHDLNFDQSFERNIGKDLADETIIAAFIQGDTLAFLSHRLIHVPCPTSGAMTRT